jgi:transposase
MGHVVNLYQVMGQFHDLTKQLESSIAFRIFRGGDLETRMVPIDLSFPS